MADWLHWLPVGVFLAVALAEGWRPRRGTGRIALGRWATNALLFFGGIGLVRLVQWAAGAAAGSALGPSPLAGLMPAGVAAPAWLGVAAGVVALDAMQYGLHRAFHVAGPWRLHALHHSDVALDASTAVRHHPLEALAATLAVAGAVWLLAIPLAALASYGVFALSWAIATHADVDWRGDQPGGRLARWLITPRLHAVHHSIDPAQAGANYGTVLAVWDRLFGTWRDVAAPAQVGLPASELPTVLGRERARELQRL